MTTYINISKYLFLLGLTLTVAGLVASLISGEWSITPIILLILGIALILNYLGILIRSNQGFWGKRSTQIGTNAVVATFFMLVMLALINFLAVRYQVRIDLTENQQFTLSPQSQKIVATLPNDLKVWVFERTQEPELKSLLDNYSNYGERFSYEFVDPNLEVALAQSFGVSAFGEIYVEYGNKKQLVNTINPGQSLSESDLTNAIVKVQRDRSPKVYFLQGHGEPLLESVEGGMSQAVEALEDNGFIVEELFLSQSPQIPADATVIILAGAERELFAGEIEALQNYLSKGGSLFLLLDPDTEPGLDPLISDWGIEVDDRFIIDASGLGSISGFGPLVPIVNTYGNHPITQDFGNGFSLYPLARTVDFNDKEGIDGVPLLITGENSWAELDVNPGEDETVEFNEGRDREGPLNLGLAMSRQINQSAKAEESQEEPEENNEAETEKQTEEKTEESSEEKAENTEENKEENSSPEKVIESRLVVIGNSSFATNGLFGEQLNSNVFLNSINWLSKDDEQALSLRPKEQTNRRLNITPVQALVLNWLALVIMPLFGLASAFFVWWRRR